MESKEEAEKTEAQLLGIFDYAWNKGGNCARRPDDILIKLNKITSSTIRFPYIARKLQKWRWDNPFIQKQVGITIKGRTSTLNGTELNTCNYKGWNNLLRILKVSRSQPQLVTGKSSLNDGHTPICGVALGDGSVCRNKPIEGRKRCGSHRGKKINGSILKLMTDADPKVFGMGLQDGCTQEDPLHERKINSCDEEPEKHLSQHSKTYRSHPQMVVERCTTIEDHTTICGVVLSDGSVCRNQPSKGRKRCGQHKGKRINRITCKLSLEKKSHVRGTGLENESVCMEVPVIGRSINSCRDLKHDELISGTSNFEKSQPQSVAGTCVSEKCTAVCEMALGDGSVCRNEAVEGRRCAQHKGMMSNWSTWRQYWKRNCMFVVLA
nr:TPA_asm: hypothetical protein HUJ06_002689 [Nelumbo nucifera]